MAEAAILTGQTIQVCHGDLTQEHVDAIVNAANSRLAHGGGVAGAILRRGGKIIQQESDDWVRQHGPVPTGKVAVTTGGSLPCRYVIHAVGPVWRGGKQDEDDLLRQACWKSLESASQLGLASIALPAISSGIFGFPKERCALILIQAALDFCQQYPHSPLREIRFTNIDLPTVNVFKAELSRALGAAGITGI
jgi:putative ATPase